MILPNNKGMWDTHPPRLIGPQQDKKIGGESLHVAQPRSQGFSLEGRRGAPWNEVACRRVGIPFSRCTLNKIGS